MTMTADRARGRVHQSADLDPEKRVDALIKLADYHRKAMEARRGVGFQAFLAVFGLNSAILFKFEDLSLLVPNVLQFASVITLICALALLAFLHAIWEIEKRNEGDRQRFVDLESQAWSLLDDHGWREFYKDFALGGRAASKQRSKRAILSSAWASSGPTICVIFLTTAVIYYVWAFKV
ncbi:MAG: hypothetical protein HY848_04045 [Betaproteobacteria bacterium]|nr:hypothetical protein [Betaproteobacteria bacterium]